MAEEEGKKTGKEEKKRTSIDDWMVRISFAEAGEADLGFKATGLDIVRKTKLALEKIMVVRSEKASREPEVRKEQKVTREPAAGEKLQVMILDDEPIVGKRLSERFTMIPFQATGKWENPKVETTFISSIAPGLESLLTNLGEQSPDTTDPTAGERD